MSYAPDNAAFALGYASILQEQDRFEEAIFTYERFLEKSPDNILVINNLAALLAEHRTDKESLQKARDLATRLSEIKQPAIMDTLGWVHYKLGDYDYAVAVLAEVVELRPDVPLFNYHLGMAYYKRGDKDKAGEYLSRAINDEYTYDGVEEARRVYKEVGGE
jgi:tetratricopeptide (TPR) repeat protein